MYTAATRITHVFTVAFPEHPRMRAWTQQGDDLGVAGEWASIWEWAVDLANLYGGHAVVTITEVVPEVPARSDGAQPIFCHDCGRFVPEGDDFWYSDWKAPSDIYCLECGGRHGYPHRHVSYFEDGWEPTEETPQQANERDARLEWESDHRNEPDPDSPAFEPCDGCGVLTRTDCLTPESDDPNAPAHCEGCRTTPHIEGWMVADTSTELDF